MTDAVAPSGDLIPIKSQTRTIQTCFQQCLYLVPNFQRPYSWSADQFQDFWDDVALARSDFFFGSTVTWVSEPRPLFNDTYSIIDGQQRLTTSAIALSVVRDAFHAIAESADGVSDSDGTIATNQATTTQRYLIITDDDGVSYPVLTRSEGMFYEKIQNRNAIPSKAKWNKSAERIGEARLFFEGCVLQEIYGRSHSAQIERLKEIRANILKARIIQVELATEEDGFLIFETLNTRGADLRLADLLKNLLIRGGAANEMDRKAIAERWDRLVDRVQDGRTGPDVADRFIWQSWNSRRSAVKEPELYKDIGGLLRGGSLTHLSYLEELEVDSVTYEWLQLEQIQTQPTVKNVRRAFSVPEFVDSIRALAVFGVSVANSTIFAIARKYEESTLVKVADLIEVLSLVEKFHFQFTALTNSGSTGGTRARYNRFAVRLEAATSRDEVKNAIADLRIKLQASLPSQDLARKAFRDLFYAPKVKLTQAQKFRARKNFVTYVLLSFARDAKLLPAGQDFASWTIEHVKPQSEGTTDCHDPVYAIGNLMLLTKEFNVDQGNCSQAAKLGALRKANVYVDPDLDSWGDTGLEFPSDAQIDARSHHLAEEALGRVWSLNV